MSKSCGGCGSRLKDDATRCDLCGTPVSGPEAVLADSSGSEAAENPDLPGPINSTTTDPIFCNSCGWRNPSDSNFCSKCGSGLQQWTEGLPVASARLPEAEPGPKRSDRNLALEGGVEPGAGKRMAIVIGVAVLLIIVVYLLLAISEQNGGVSALSTPRIDSNAPTEPPLIDELASRERDLYAELENLAGEDRIDKERELLTLYFTARRFDLAGAKAEEIARVTGAESAWIDAGNFYYDWMETSEPENKSYYSQKSTSAYRKALELNPDNLDIRTDMAVAYLYDPENSMLAIQETMKVLEADSNHVQANFNRGIMLWQINRLDEAADQFEKVVRLVDDPDDAVSQRASEALLTLRTESAVIDSGS